MNTRWGHKIGTSIIVGLVSSIPLSVASAKPKNSDQFSHNAIFLEAFGPGILYSINYDYRFARDLSVRVGYSSWDVPFDLGFFSANLKFRGFPVEVNYLPGNGPSHLDLGIGFEPDFSRSGAAILDPSSQTTGSGVLGIATIGYRFQQRHGLFFQVGLTPLFNFNRLAPYAGISIGAAF